MSAARTAARPRPRRRVRPTTIGYIAIIAFMFLAGVGAILAFASVGAYVALTRRPREPREADRLRLPRRDGHLRPDGQDRARPLRRRQARGRHLRRDPQGPARRHDGGRGQDLLGERRLRPGRRSRPRRWTRCAASSRGASTITQQLVRARLLDPELVQDPHRTAERKLKEIIQSIRVTQHFSGPEGKEQIITAYLNQNYYGNQSYGVKAAVKSYFGIELDEIDPAQAAIIAGLPKSPSNYDLVRNAIERCTTVVDEDDRLPEVGARRPQDHHDRPAARPDPRPSRVRPDADVGPASTAPPSSPSPSARTSSSGTRRPPAGSPRTSSGPSATSSPTSCAARTCRRATSSIWVACG